MASLSSFMPPSIILLYIIWWTGEEAYRVVCAPTQVGCQYDMQYDMLQLPRGFLQPKDGRACGIFSKNQSGLERQVASVGQEGPVGEEKMESNCRGHAAGAPPPPPPSFVSGISDMHMAIIVTNPHLRHYPLLTPDLSMDKVVSVLLHSYSGSFCWATCFEPSFVARLIYAGFLPMGDWINGGLLRWVLMPKLHQSRCVLRWPNLHVQKKVRKRSKQYHMSCDGHFDLVMKLCLERHGDAWLHPGLQQAIRRIHDEEGGMCGVHMHSFELWEASELVAGEIGYSVGGSYTSLSGFSLKGSAGSVQCVATARTLEKAGAKFWDLGMELAYKMDLGGECLSRGCFLEMLAKVRDERPLSFETSRTSASGLCGPGVSRPPRKSAETLRPSAVAVPRDLSPYPPTLAKLASWHQRESFSSRLVFIPWSHVDQ